MRGDPAILPVPRPSARRTLCTVRQSSSPAAPVTAAPDYSERLGLPWWAWPIGLALAGLSCGGAGLLISLAGLVLALVVQIT
ncbi:hypothetical protein GCM10027452_05830 [Micromonospora halotolerans]